MTGPSGSATTLPASDTLFVKLEARLLSLENTRANLEALFNARTVNQDMLDNAYIGLYVAMCVEFEGFVEELFLSLLIDSDGVVQVGVAATLIIADRNTTKAVVIGPGKDFGDWLPFHRTLEKAEVFFQRGEPFSRVSGDQKSYINEMMWLRNALAHSSDYSRQTFLDKLVGQRLLGPREKTPVGFLRLKTRNNMTIYEEHRLRLMNIARTLIGL